MEKEFITYNQALALKELGFDEPCIGWYNPQVNYKEVTTDRYWAFHLTGEWENFKPAPLYQQAFKFFREKYNLDGSMSVDVWNKKTTSYRIIGGIEGIVEADSYGSLYDMDSTEYDSYEESEQECLNKLIEIVKDK